MRPPGIHVGVVGVGRIGAFHARTLAGSADVDRLTVVDDDSERASKLSAVLGAETRESPEALVTAGVDALVVATSTPAHAPLLSLAAGAGIPAFCEKPVALELDVIDAVAEEVDRADVLVQVGFQRRFDAGYLAARDAVANGTLGRLLLLRAATHDPVPPAGEYIAASGGIFRDLHIHDFDAIRFVTGQEVSEVYADGAVRETPWFEDYGDVDAAAAVLRLADGTLAVLTGTRHDPLGYDIRMELLGSGDSVAVGWDERLPLRSVEPGAAPAPADAYGGFQERFAAAYRAEMAAFVEVAAGRQQSACTAEDALEAMRVAVACDLSRAEHRPVRLDEVA
jgi:myo-inositol 2-dehydrogenase/D-chiro-inositol 1-dehydrogenase